MDIQGKSMAGTVESSDCLVYIEPAATLEIEIESVVAKQFGSAIYKAVQEVLAELHTSQVKVFVKDRGALDCVIKARVETAVRRAVQGGEKQ